MLWWILLVVSSIFIYVKIFRPLSHWSDRHVVHDKPWPIVGNIGRLLIRRTCFAEHLQELYNRYPNRYIGFFQLMKPTLLLKDIDLVKQITVKDYEYFLNHRSITPEDIDPIFGKNLFSLKGQKWRHMRSTLSPAFTGSKMRFMFVLISECAEQFTNHFLKNSDPNKPTTIEMRDTITRFANDVIATCAFGIKCDSLEERNNEFYLMGRKATDFTGFKGFKFFGYSFSPFLMKLLKVKLFDDEVSDFYRNLVRTTIDTREQQGIIRPDMIHLLMQARKGQLKYDETGNFDNDAGFATVEESNVGKQKENRATELTNDDITAQAMLFFLAGFDTISTMMCFTAYELTVNTDIQKRLQEEIDLAFQEGGGKITYDIITKMKYLDMVVSESLRKWPAALMTDRVCSKNYVINPVTPDEKPYKFYKDDLIWIPIYAIQRDAAYYPNPDKFDPERFNDDNKDKIKPFTYMPFGLGPRNCIGSRFALLEAKTVFVHLLAKFELVPVEKTPIPLRLSRNSFNLSAQNGFWLGLKPRK